MTKTYVERWDAGCDSRPLLEEADNEIRLLSGRCAMVAFLHYGSSGPDDPWQEKLDEVTKPLHAEIERLKAQQEAWYGAEAKWNAKVMDFLRHAANGERRATEAQALLDGHREIERPTLEPLPVASFLEQIKSWRNPYRTHYNDGFNYALNKVIELFEGASRDTPKTNLAAVDLWLESYCGLVHPQAQKALRDILDAGASRDAPLEHLEDMTIGDCIQVGGTVFPAGTRASVVLGRIRLRSIAERIADVEGASRDASPADLVGALQDVVHTDTGPVRAAHAVRDVSSGTAEQLFRLVPLCKCPDEGKTGFRSDCPIHGNPERTDPYPMCTGEPRGCPYIYCHSQLKCARQSE